MTTRMRKVKQDMQNAVSKCGSGAGPERIPITDSIRHVACLVVVYNTADPCQYRCRDFDPLA